MIDIAAAFEAIAAVADVALQQREPTKDQAADAVASALALGELIVTDIHRIADALERTANAAEASDKRHSEATAKWNKANGLG